MATGTAGARGYTPQVEVGPDKSTKVAEVSLTPDQVRTVLGISEEQEQYLKIWGSIPEYRKVSPGEIYVPMFLDAATSLRADEHLIDFGCGTGRGGFTIFQQRGVKTTLVDFAANCLDDNIAESLSERLQFVEHDITKPIGLEAEWGYCCDCMEHLRPEQIDSALNTILDACNNVFFLIATGPDHFGQHPDIGHPLHLTQRDYSWWLQKFSDHGVVVHRSMEQPGHVVFFVSGHRPDFLSRFAVNTDTKVLRENLRKNVELGIQQTKIHPTQETEIMFVAGGPSLNEYEDEIIKRRAQGTKLITVNGAYNWCIERGMRPSAALVLDAREFNARFIRPIVDGCAYFVSPCCDPSMFDGLPKERTYLWNVHLEGGIEDDYKELFGAKYEDWVPIVGGCTVALRGLYLMKILGLGVTAPVDVYGMDSCITDVHHAYEQKENDDAEVIRVTLNKGKDTERTFECHPWMLAQARDFVLMRKYQIHDMDIRVKGDGLIKYLLETGAHLDEVK